MDVHLPQNLLEIIGFDPCPYQQAIQLLIVGFIHLVHKIQLYPS